MSTAERSIFTKIIDREIPAEIVFENERFIAFHDIAPKAPVHIVLVPKDARYRDVVELAAGAPELLAELVSISKHIASETSDGQFRLIFNTGEQAGQTIFHVHGHILGGHLPEGTLAN